MKIPLLLSFILLINSYSFSQSWEWAVPHNATQGYAVSCTSSGNFIIGGQEDFGPGVLIKTGPTGNEIWRKTMGPFSSIKGVVTNSAGDIFVCGVSSGRSMIARLDSNGVFVWKINGTNQSFNGLTSDNSGNLYTTGDSSVITKFNSSGNQIWSMKAGATGNRICSDSFGNLIVTGGFSDTVVMGSFALIAKGRHDIFVIKYDSTGTCLWAKRAGGNSSTISYSRDNGYGVTSDSVGNIYITGSFVDTADFDQYQLFCNNPNGNEVFIVKYNISGDVQWVRAAVGYSDDEGRAIGIDGKSNLFVGGSYVPYLYFGNINGPRLTGWGNYDAFLAKYDLNGNFQSAIDAGGYQWNEFVYDLTRDKQGEIVAVGSISTDVHFDNQVMPGTNGYRAFIAKPSLLMNIQDEKSDNEVSIYPNPSNGTFYLQNSSLVALKAVSVFTTTGSRIKTVEGNGSSTIEINEIEKGLYFLFIEFMNGVIICKRIVSVK